MIELTPEVQNNINKFFEFVYDRQKIWYKKEVGKLPPPWTNDPVLQKYLFCNVFRELDRGSKYLIDKVIDSNLTFENKVFNIFAYRLFNVYGFFENILEGLLDIDNFNVEHYINLLDEKKKTFKLFNEAYTICQVPINYDYRGVDKHVQNILRLDVIKNSIKGVNWKNKFLNSSLKEQLKWIDDFHGIAAFLAFQIYLDISYTKEKGLFTGDDFVEIGDGAAKGIMYMNPLLNTLNLQKEFCTYLRDNQTHYFNELFNRTGKNWFIVRYKSKYYLNENLSLLDVQQSLCEYKKYMNIYSNINYGTNHRTRYYKKHA